VSRNPSNSRLPDDAGPADGFAVRLAVFWAVSFVGIGIYQPYFPLWLEAKGLSSAEIGVVLAAPMVMRLLTVQLTSTWADRSGRLDRALAVFCLAGAAMAAAGAGVEGFVGLLLLNALVAVAWGPTVPVTDAYAMAGLTRRKIGYGPVRLWASVAFMAAGFAVGAVLDWLPPLWIIWLLVGAFLASGLAAFLLVPDAPREPAGTHPSPGIRPLLTRPAVLAMLAAGLVQASHALLFGFGTLHWTAAGHPGVFIGFLWAVGVIAEIVLFAFSGRFAGRVAPLVLITIGGVAGVLRFAILAADPGPVALVFQQTMHALTFGATHLGLVAFMAALAPPGRYAQAQGLASTVGVAAMAVAMAASGPLYAAYGSRAFLFMAGLAALGLVAAALAAGPVRHNGR
jgi:PPP family 3-phenylpropionic acid transporter